MYLPSSHLDFAQCKDVNSTLRRKEAQRVTVPEAPVQSSSAQVYANNKGQEKSTKCTLASIATSEHIGSELCIRNRETPHPQLRPSHRDPVWWDPTASRASFQYAHSEHSSLTQPGHVRAASQLCICKCTLYCGRQLCAGRCYHPHEDDGCTKSQPMRKDGNTGAMHWGKQRPPPRQMGLLTPIS